MLLSKKYLRSALSLRHGRLILITQAILIIVVMYVFSQTIPWLMAHDISEITRYPEAMPQPPVGAKSFSINHGDFIYYPDSRGSNPGRMISYILLNLIFMVPFMALMFFVKRKAKT